MSPSLADEERLQGHLDRGECPLCLSLLNGYIGTDAKGRPLHYFQCSSGRHHYRAQPHLLDDGYSAVWDGLMQASIPMVTTSAEEARRDA